MISSSITLPVNFESRDGQLGDGKVYVDSRVGGGRGRACHEVHTAPDHTQAIYIKAISSLVAFRWIDEL